MYLLAQASATLDFSLNSIIFMNPKNSQISKEEIHSFSWEKQVNFHKILVHLGHKIFQFKYMILRWIFKVSTHFWKISSISWILEVYQYNYLLAHWQKTVISHFFTVVQLKISSNTLVAQPKKILAQSWFEFFISKSKFPIFIQNSQFFKTLVTPSTVLDFSKILSFSIF